MDNTRINSPIGSSFSVSLPDKAGNDSIPVTKAPATIIKTLFRHEYRLQEVAKLLHERKNAWYQIFPTLRGCLAFSKNLVCSVSVSKLFKISLETFQSIKYLDTILLYNGVKDRPECEISNANCEVRYASIRCFCSISIPSLEFCA